MSYRDMLYLVVLMIGIWAGINCSKVYGTRKYRYVIFGSIYTAAMLVLLLLYQNKI